MRWPIRKTPDFLSLPEQNRRFWQSTHKPSAPYASIQRIYRRIWQLDLLFADTATSPRKRKEKCQNKDNQNNLDRIFTPPIPRDDRLFLMQILRCVLRHACHFI